MRRQFKFVILVVIAVLALWWFGRGLDWAAVRTEVGRADWRLIAAAVVIVCLTYLLRAYRWRVLLAPLAPASVRELFAATTVGFGTVFVVGRTGEVLRPAFLALRERRVRPGAAFVTIGIERLFDMSAVVVLFAINLIWFRVPGGEDADKYAPVRVAGLIMLAGLAVGVAGLIWFKRHSGGFIRWLDGKFAGGPSVVNRVGRLLCGLLDQLAGALSVLVNMRELLLVIGWTIFLWMVIVAANWLVLRAFGLSFGLSETLFVLGWSLVGSLVPTPGGGAGAFHTTTKAGLDFIGVAAEQAAAVSIIMHLVLFAPAFFIGLYYFARSDVRLARLRSLATAEENVSVDGARGGFAPIEDRLTVGGGGGGDDGATPQAGVHRSV